ncbi:MAG: twin-arginine translocase TatA/TatE family subunit [Elusimicrobia bacterium]|nr:twin-arginine translocase TatA/TatE family subunit [Elusimicrobiota bacterium]
MFQNLGTWDWLIILFIVLLLFGGKKLPELSRSIGKAISTFKKGLKEGEDDLKSNEDKKDNQTPPIS